MPSAPRMSKRLSQAPRMSIIMAGDDPQERKREVSVREICADHVKTIATLLMIFGTIACIVVIVLIHKWHFEESRVKEIEACLDVAVIGAGISGSYATWRMRHDPKAIVHLFELSSSPGGRLRTVQFPDYESGKMKAELGALYYFPQRHPLLNRTIHALRLTPEGYYPPNRDPPTYYFRGSHRTRSDFRTHSGYRLDAREKGMTPEELKRYYTERYLPENIHENPLLVKYKKYVNLYDMGYWNFLNTVASREGFNFIQDGAPWRSHVSNGNAALLATLDLNTWEYHSTVAEGMQELPKLMARQFANSSHRHVVHYNRRLVCIRKKQWLHGVYYELIFQHTETIDDIVYNITKSERFCANKVILAISPAAIKHIRFVGFEDDTPSITGLINAVLDPIPAMTAYLLFNESWWSGSRPGYEDVITDLSLRRTRYIASSRRKPRPGTDSKRPEYGHLFLAANPDFLDVSYFDPLVKHGSVMHSECNLTKQGLLDLKTQFAKLQALKDASSLPDPIGIYVKDWRSSPSYAAWHLWKTGVRWDKEATRLRKPLPNDDIYLIGGDLCPGSCQLWVEGALQTVESLLESHFPKYYVMPLEGVTATADSLIVDDEVKMPLYN